MHRKAILLILPLLAVAAALFWLGPDDTFADKADTAGMSAAHATTAMTSTTGTPASFVTGLEGLPASLADTEVDGTFELDANGNLKITSGIRNVFDYFLSAGGEEPLETVLQRLRAYIRHKLPAGPAAEAERILDGYLAYKQGIATLTASAQSSGSTEIDIGAVRQQMQQIRALRTQFLSPEVIAAFFADEDAHDRYTLARYEIMQNPRLSPQQRASQLADTEQMLPPAMQESLKAINQYQNLQALTQDWQQRKGSPTELRQIRENLVGAEATERLEKLDRERAAWNQRMQAWLSERAALMGNRNLSEPDRQSQLSALRTQRFSAEEHARVEALEQIHDKG